MRLLHSYKIDENRAVLVSRVKRSECLNIQSMSLPYSIRRSLVLLVTIITCVLSCLAGKFYSNAGVVKNVDFLSCCSKSTLARGTLRGRVSRAKHLSESFGLFPSLSVTHALLNRPRGKASLWGDSTTRAVKDAHIGAFGAVHVNPDICVLKKGGCQGGA